MVALICILPKQRRTRQVPARYQCACFQHTRIEVCVLGNSNRGEAEAGLLPLLPPVFCGVPPKDNFDDDYGDDEDDDTDDDNDDDEDR